jgi:hypothetical protein
MPVVLVLTQTVQAAAVALAQRGLPVLMATRVARVALVYLILYLLVLLFFMAVVGAGVERKGVSLLAVQAVVEMECCIPPQRGLPEALTRAAAVVVRQPIRRLPVMRVVAG